MFEIQVFWNRNFSISATWATQNRRQTKIGQGPLINILGGRVDYFVCDRCWENQLYGL
jgi:hypothetical protein